MNLAILLTERKQYILTFVTLYVRNQFGLIIYAGSFHLELNFGYFLLIWSYDWLSFEIPADYCYQEVGLIEE